MKNNITQAAANKAAEEGGLPEDAQHFLAIAMLGFHGQAEPNYDTARLTLSKVLGAPHVRKAIAADRASRQVANKAEVQPVAHLYKWIGDASDSYEGRVIARSVAELKGEIDMYPESWERIGPLYATPPATTGAMPKDLAIQCLNALDVDSEAHAALSKFIIEGGATGASTAIELDAYDAGLLSDFGGGDVNWWQDYIRVELDRAHDFYQSQVEGSVGASTVLTDERTSIDTQDFQTFNNDRLGLDVTGNVYKELVAYIDQHVAREVAAQAGQVAVPADTARLDWLQKTNFNVLYPGSEYATWQALGGQMGKISRDGHLDFRAAIDRAMLAAPSLAKESK